MATVIYARKSSDRDDRQILSLDAQVKVLKEIAEREKITVVEIIEEAGSAKNPGARPEFERMVSQIKKGRITGILTWQINRLSRNSVDGGIISYLLQSGRLEFIRTPERAYLPEDNALILAVETGMSINYLQNLSRDVSRGLREKTEQGWYYGAAPYGYVNNRQTRAIDPHPTEFEIIKHAWKLLLTGQYNIQEIQRTIEGMGLKGRQHHTLDKPASRTILYRIFSSSFYAGELNFKGKTYPGKHIPMITLAEFCKAQSILGKKPVERPVRHRHPFAGTLKCGICGCSVVGSTKVKHYKGTARTVRYTYYHCSGAKGCRKTGITEKQLFESVLKFYASINLTERHVKAWSETALAESWRRDAIVSEISLSEQKRNLVVVEERTRKLQGLLVDGDISPTDYREIKESLDKQEYRLQRDIQRLKIGLEEIDHEIHEKLKATLELGTLAKESIDGLKGNLRCIGDHHTLTLKKLKLEVDPVVRVVAAFEPHNIDSGSGKSDLDLSKNPVWAATVNQARKLAWERKLREMSKRDTEIRPRHGPRPG